MAAPRRNIKSLYDIRCSIKFFIARQAKFLETYQYNCSTYLDIVPKRLSIAVMMFFACFFSYMLRVNMSINLLAMVQQTDENGTQIEMPDVGNPMGYIK